MRRCRWSSWWFVSATAVGAALLRDPETMRKHLFARRDTGLPTPNTEANMTQPAETAQPQIAECVQSRVAVDR